MNSNDSNCFLFAEIFNIDTGCPLKWYWVTWSWEFIQPSQNLPFLLLCDLIYEYQALIAKSPFFPCLCNMIEYDWPLPTFFLCCVCELPFFLSLLCVSGYWLPFSCSCCVCVKCCDFCLIWCLVLLLRCPLLLVWHCCFTISHSSPIMSSLLHYISLFFSKKNGQKKFFKDLGWLEESSQATIVRSQMKNGAKDVLIIHPVKLYKKYI